MMNIRVNRISKNDDGTMSFVFGDWANADDAVLFAESFDDCNGTGANDGSWMPFKVATGTFRPDNQGWSASYLKGGRHCARVGNMSAEDLISPSINFTGSTTLSFRAAPFTGEGTMTLTISLDNSDLTLSQTQFTLTQGEWGNFSTEISGTGSAKLTFSADCRLYLDDVLVRDNTQTGIECIPGIKSERTENTLYDLQGRKANSTTSKGVFIQDGKKIIK
jgi:hypothetical protein